jgi:hypothetical protein
VGRSWNLGELSPGESVSHDGLWAQGACHAPAE